MQMEFNPRFVVGIDVAVLLFCSCTNTVIVEPDCGSNTGRRTNSIAAAMIKPNRRTNFLGSLLFSILPYSSVIISITYLLAEWNIDPYLSRLTILNLENKIRECYLTRESTMTRMITECNKKVLLLDYLIESYSTRVLSSRKR